MKFTTKRLSMLGLVVMLIASACGPAATPTVMPPTAVPTPAVPPTPAATLPPPMVLRWSLEGITELPSLDPALAGASQSVAVDNLIFEGLVRLDDQLNVIPAGAEKWDTKDAKVFTFTIRKGLKFADGTPVTAEDFAYSLNRAFQPEIASKGVATYYLANISGAMAVADGKAKTISGVKVIDPQTLQITLDTPSVYFLYQLTFPSSFVVPKALVEKLGDKWVDQAYGFGPFMVKEWKHNQSITLVPNPNYYGGKIQISEIRMPFIQDAETALKLYQTGELDIMGTQNFPTAQIPTVSKLPDFHQLAQFFITYIGFNNKRKPFDNMKVRQAFALAVDKKTLTEKVLEGAVVAADTIVPPGMPGFNKDVKTLAFDPAAAKKALADAEYAGGKGFPKVALAINNQDLNYAKIAATLQQMWKENLGVTIDIKTEELAKFNEDLTAMQKTPEKGFDFYLSVWGADYPDPQNFTSQQLRTGVGNNNGNWSNADFDKLVDQADVEPDQVKRLSLYQQAEQIAITEVGWLPLYYGKMNVLMKPGVSGITITAQGLMVKDWTKVTITK